MAMYRIASGYVTGDLFNKNFGEGKRWAKLASEYGHVEAARLLADIESQEVQMKAQLTERKLMQEREEQRRLQLVKQAQTQRQVKQSEPVRNSTGESSLSKLATFLGELIVVGLVVGVIVASAGAAAPLAVGIQLPSIPQEMHPPGLVRSSYRSIGTLDAPKANSSYSRGDYGNTLNPPAATVYQGRTGTQYQYDLSRPLDSTRYSTDVRAQLRDSLNVRPQVETDRWYGQRGGGVLR